METFSPRSPDASETLWFDLSQFAKWKITESLLSVNQQSRGSAMASKELYPQITLWFFSQSDPENHPFFVSQKSSNPDEWQGRTVNLLWLMVSNMFFFPRWLLHHQPVMKTGVYQRVSHLPTPHDTGEDPHVVAGLGQLGAATLWSGGHQSADRSIGWPPVNCYTLRTGKWTIYR
jgi:hypothetical protein